MGNVGDNAGRAAAKVAALSALASRYPDEYKELYLIECAVRGLIPYAKLGKPFRDVCAQGHPMTPDNVYTKPSGRRECRICRNKGKREYKRRKAQTN
jgi:hypothetical protein